METKKNLLFERIFSLYNRNLLKRRFNAVGISGLSNLLSNHLNYPMIIYCNHSSWWDGLIALSISETAQMNSFFMMEEKQLKKFFLFRRLGAFSVVRENPRQAVKSIRYAAKLLKEESNRTLWIFPQGEILPNDVRPLFFYNGISRIIEKTEKCVLIPIAFRYEFLGEFKPDVFVDIGNIMQINIGGKFNSKEFTLDLAENLTLILDNLKSKINKENFQDFQNII